MTLFTFGSFEEYNETIKAGDSRMVILSPESSPWHLQIVDFGEVRLLRGTDASYGFYEATLKNGEVAIYAPDTGSPEIKINSVETTPDRPFLVFSGEQFVLRSHAPAKYTVIAINHAMLARIDSHSTSLGKIYKSKVSQLLPQGATRELLALAARVLQIDTHEPSAIFHPRIRENITRCFFGAASAVFENQSEPNTKAKNKKIDDAKIARISADFIKDNLGSGIYVPDIAKFAGISQRSLNSIFNETYGMNVVRYMQHIRLSLIRNFIRNSTDSESIANICISYGVWDFGRFSGSYKRTFGVLPSQEGRATHHPDRSHPIKP